MRLRIESDNIFMDGNVRVVSEETGELIEGVQAIEFLVDARDYSKRYVKLIVIDPEIDCVVPITNQLKLVAADQDE